MKDLHFDLGAQNAQLLDRRGTVHVGGHQQWSLPALLEVEGQLCGAARLARSLEPEQHERARAAPGCHLLGVRSQQLAEFLVARLGEAIAERNALPLPALAGAERALRPQTALLPGIQEGSHLGEVHVGFEQRHSDLA